MPTPRMPNEDAFARWSPATSPWSDWVKPSLFATTTANVLAAATQVTHQPLELGHLPETRDRAAIVLELPGVTSVSAALSLANQGYRPVPLYNTCYGAKCVVDVLPIASALVGASAELEALRIKDDAPPAFMLDSNRLRPQQPVSEGKFDNRWMVFPQDFPSAAYLRSRGIERAVVVQEGDSIRDDLAHVLLRWQEGGIRLSVTKLGAGEEVRPLVVSKPPLYRRAWYRVMAMMGLRRSNVGGFGAVVPIAAAG